MKRNFQMNCLPVDLLDGKTPGYDLFLESRRKLMAEKIKAYFELL